MTTAIGWLILLAVLLLIEAVTVGLTTIWFAGGALIALILSFFGVNFWIQVGVFLLVSLVLLIFTRPAAIRLMNQRTEKTNVDALVGRAALVTERVDNLKETGTVQVDGLTWAARSSREGELIEPETVVKILKVSGVKLLVEPVRASGGTKL